MGGRIAVLTVLAALGFAGTAHAEDFSLDDTHGGVRDASAEGSVTFNDDGGATITITVTDRAPDGACAKAWVTSNLPPDTHTTYEACKAAEQRTYTLALPGGARCNVAFVEVLVGRIDHSEGDKVELGESKRMNNPCPPPATPTPVPTPAPPAKIVSGIDHNWTAFRTWTRNERLLVTDIPDGAAVELRCRGKGCPARRKTVAVRNGRADAHRVLRRRHLRVGTVLELRITRAGMIGKVRRFTIRRSKTPATQLLCLPPGATHPARC
jgi:hypothetical protein